MTTRLLQLRTRFQHITAPFERLEAPRERRRARYIFLINAILLIGGLGSMLLNGGRSYALLPIGLNAIFNFAVMLLIWRRYPLGVKVFVIGQPALNFINLLFADLNAVLYVVTSFLCVCVFLRDQRTILIYSAIVQIGLIAASLLTTNDARYASIGHDDLFLFIVAAVLVTTITALVTAGDNDEIKLQALALRRSEAQLRRANQDLENFAFIVSHDLKAPLRGVHAVAGWIAEDYGDKLDEEGRKLVGIMQNRVVRMEQMIDGILAYSRVGRDNEAREWVNLNQLIPEIAELIVPQGRGIVTVETPLPSLMIEPTQIRQIFQNLIDNAVKYCDKPCVDIRISAQVQGAYWKFVVADNGIGIDPRHHERIFGIFQTLTSRDQTDSTGVGLAILKRIVENYGGIIGVDSTLGNGSRFYFTLPTTLNAPTLSTSER